MAHVIYVNALNHVFSIDVSYVKKIIQLPELEVLPGAPDDVAGMFNYGGKIIPVYDLVMLIGNERDVPYTLNTLVVICSQGNKEVGLIVDGIKGQDDIRGMHADERIQSDNTYLESVITVNNTVIMRPAMSKIIARQLKLEEKL